jgi:hypothetical protein
MSWDIVLFSSRQTINSEAEVDEEQLEPTDFCVVLESHFEKIEKNDNHRRIIGQEFEIEYFIDNEKVSNKILNLYGEQGLFEIIKIARQNNWQIFDTGLGEMINLENPEKNGYDNFRNYLTQILKDN